MPVALDRRAGCPCCLLRVGIGLYFYSINSVFWLVSGTLACRLEWTGAAVVSYLSTFCVRWRFRMKMFALRGAQEL